MKRKSTRLFAGTVLFFGLTLPALADEQTLSGHVPAVVAAGLRPVGLLPATNVLHLSLELPPRNRDALVGLVGQIYDPKSTNFHSYLTPQQFTERFGPTVQDYEALENFAQSNHFTVESTFSNRTLLAVSGHVVDINAAFRITLRTYRHPVENREFYAPDAEPKVDSRLPAFRINGLDNYVLPHPMGLFRTPANRTSGNTSSAGSAPGGGNFWGYDYRNAYVPGSNLTGAGQTVALFEDDGFYLTDITNYEISSGLPEVIPTVILVSSATGIPSTNGNAVGEVSLDIESVISMAPGLANLLVYEGNDDASMLTQMAQDDRAQQISSSWNIPRASTNDTELLQMAAQGQTFFYASGDGLAYVGAINSLTDDPYVTSVGGTKLDTTTNGTWKSEVVWNNGNGTNGSSGGVSTFYSIPIWQQNVNMSANGGSTTFRNIPDVAMVGDNCYFFWNNGDQGGWWGTSIASPLWAGFTALVNQQAASQGLPPVGLLNPAIYNIAGGPLYASCFHDIISGNNTNRFSNNEFFAQPGYDLCTGWGSPGTNLISALVSYGGTVWVDFNYTGTTQIGTFNAPFSTLAQATSAVPFGGNIWIRSAGSSRETMKISKSMSIHAYNGAATVGN